MIAFEMSAQTTPTNDMRNFPDADGVHVLYGYNDNGTLVYYVATDTNLGTYIVDTSGTVTQVTFEY